MVKVYTKTFICNANHFYYTEEIHPDEIFIYYFISKLLYFIFYHHQSMLTKSLK